MARAKMGDRFSEEEFQNMMASRKKSEERKDAFSYEHEGYENRYYEGPSYEGYSKEHMIFSKVFEYIGDDIDPREIKQYCSEPEKMADIIIAKFREKTSTQIICSKFEEKDSSCGENAKKTCEQVGKPYVREGASDMEKINALAYSCPMNKENIMEACVKRSKFYSEQRLRQSGKDCEDKFNFDGERRLKECGQFRQNSICDREKYMSQCIGPQSDEGSESRDKLFSNAKWECYDGTVESHSDNSCKSHSYWSEAARKSCESHCNKETGKCGVNGISVSGECGMEKPACPQYPIPQCDANAMMKSKSDSNGCVYYYCETKAVCPQNPVPDCGQGSMVREKRDSNNCVYYYCEASAPSCQEPQMPACASGSTVEKKTDEKGCVYYYCSTPACQEVSKPTCPSNERMETSYDSSGCITGYHCIKTCPEPAKPICSESQTIITKYDSSGCTYYECTDSTSSNNSITGAITGNDFDDNKRRCEEYWQQQKKSCEAMPESCTKEDLIENCRKTEDKHQSGLDAEKNCQTLIEPELKAVADRCSKLEQEKSKCIEHNEKRCSQMEGLLEQCKTLLTEDNLRKFIIEEANKRCRFSDILEDEDKVNKADSVDIILAVLNTATQSDIEKLELFVENLKEELKLEETIVYKGTISPKSFGDVKSLPFVVNAKISTSTSSNTSKETKTRLVSGYKAEEAASRLASLRDSGVPSEYLYIIEDKASDVLNVSENLGNIEKKQEEKGFGYKIKLFLGLAKAAEQEEIRQLEESNSKLQNSIDTLTKLVDEIPNDVAKAVLKEQVEKLKEQQADTKVLIGTKEKKAKGLFGVFG